MPRWGGWNGAQRVGGWGIGCPGATGSQVSLLLSCTWFASAHGLALTSHLAGPGGGHAGGCQAGGPRDGCHHAVRCGCLLLPCALRAGPPAMLGSLLSLAFLRACHRSRKPHKGGCPVPHCCIPPRRPLARPAQGAAARGSRRPAGALHPPEPGAVPFCQAAAHGRGRGDGRGDGRGRRGG